MAILWRRFLDARRGEAERIVSFKNEPCRPRQSRSNIGRGAAETGPMLREVASQERAGICWAEPFGHAHNTHTTPQVAKSDYEIIWSRPPRTALVLAKRRVTADERNSAELARAERSTPTGEEPPPRARLACVQQTSASTRSTLVIY